jgi:signal transduction histidine kinase
MGDYRQLFQGITNLIGNAVKYTPENGKIEVRLSKQGNMVRFEVQDNGYGISEDGQKHLFQEFYRVRSAATAHIQGTGLGLSLVKAVIEAHGGKIWVVSKEGVGSTFFVEIPIFEGTLDDE